MIASRHPLSAPRRLTFTQRSVWYEHLIAKGALAADVAPPGGPPLRIATAHMAVVRYDVRQAAFRADDAATNAGQLAELADWLAEASTPGPMILAGDLNLIDRPPGAGRQGTAAAAGYRTLLERLGLCDAWREHHPDEAGATFDPGTNAYAARGRCRHIPAQRIDYVLYRGPGLASDDAALVFHERPLLSDHYGLRADFRLDAKIPASSAGGVTSSWS